MSKKIKPRRRAALILTVLAAAMLPLGARPGAAQQAPAAATVNPKSAAVIAATTEVLRETSEIRQLAILRQVHSGAQSRAEIERMIMRNLNENTTPEEIRASELALKKLGLAPADFKLREFIVQLLTEQVAGYYDPKAREFYLADWIDLDGQKPVIAHELTHALQDQHFNLRRFENWPKGDSDAELATQALVEGDATLTMMFYALRNPLRALALMRPDKSGEASMEQLKRAPRALRETLLFPYEQGMAWAFQVQRRGGWELLSRAYTDLPQSTEQILHFDKYLAREAPVKVEMPDLSSRLSANWKRTDYDVNGEWSFYLILDEYLNVTSESKQAAAGWSGDRYALYEEGNTGVVMLAQLSVWDTEEDARQFFDAYAKRTPLRYKDAAAEKVDLSEPASRTWRTSEGAVMMERRGMRVAIIEGVPEKTNARELMRSLWR